jgi:hypothetical protein
MQGPSITLVHLIVCREKAAFAYEIVREKLKSDTVQRPLYLEAAETAVWQAKVAAFEAVRVECSTAREMSKVQDPVAWQKSKAVIDALNAASGGNNERMRLRERT